MSVDSLLYILYDITTSFDVLLNNEKEVKLANAETMTSKIIHTIIFLPLLLVQEDTGELYSL